MSVSFKLDDNNNIVAFSNISTIDGKDSLAQDIKTRLYMLKGEYPFNTEKGIDYIDYMRANDEVGLLSAIQSRILEDERVVSVDFETDKDNDKLVITCNLESDENITLSL